MKYKLSFTLFSIACLALSPAMGGEAFAKAKASAPAASPAAKPDQDKRIIRLYRDVAGKKQYVIGRHWVQMTPEQKIQLVERARQGAVSMGVVFTLPAEIYVRQLDRMFQNNPTVLNIEIGQAIEGAAIALKDWDDGTDPDKKLKAYLKASEKSNPKNPSPS